MQNSNYSAHIFGTPSPSQGFQHKTLTQNDLLKKEYAQYLDKFDSNRMEEGYSYVIKKQTVDNNKFTILSLFRKIKVDNSRGGDYIGIAIVINGDISLNDSILYYQIISEIYGHISAYIVDNKFIDGFLIKHYHYPIDKIIDATYLLDMLSKASKETQSGRLGTITYNSKNHPDTVYKDQTFDTTPFKEEFEKAKKEAEKQRDEANRKLTSMTKDYKSIEDSRQALAIELTKYKSSYTSLVNKLELTEKSKNQAVSDLNKANNKIAINGVASNFDNLPRDTENRNTQEISKEYQIIKDNMEYNYLDTQKHIKKNRVLIQISLGVAIVTLVIFFTLLFK